MSGDVIQTFSYRLDGPFNSGLTPPLLRLILVVSLAVNVVLLILLLRRKKAQKAMDA